MTLLELRFLYSNTAIEASPNANGSNFLVWPLIMICSVSITYNREMLSKMWHCYMNSLVQDCVCIKSIAWCKTAVSPSLTHWILQSCTEPTKLSHHLWQIHRCSTSVYVTKVLPLTMIQNTLTKIWVLFQYVSSYLRSFPQTKFRVSQQDFSNMLSNWLAGKCQPIRNQISPVQCQFSTKSSTLHLTKRWFFFSQCSNFGITVLS